MDDGSLGVLAVRREDHPQQARHAGQIGDGSSGNANHGHAWISANVIVELGQQLPSVGAVHAQIGWGGETAHSYQITAFTSASDCAALICAVRAWRFPTQAPDAELYAVAFAITDAANADTVLLDAAAMAESIGV